MDVSVDASEPAAPRNEARQPVAATPAHEDPLAAQKDNIAQLSEISRNSQTTFLALIVACVYSYLTIATTTDAALLSNSNATPLPIIQVNVPIVWFYWFAPIILTVLFVYFHLYLERFWRGVARLPLRHPDGRGLDDYVYPWLISCAVIRGEIGELSGRHRLSARLEAWLSLLLGWGLVPFVLLFYWGRYIVAHDGWGTTLHAALVLLSIGVAMHYLGVARNALRQMGAGDGATGDAAARPRDRGLTAGQKRTLIAVLLGASVGLAFLSSAALHSASMPDCEASDAGWACRLYAPGRRLWHAIGVEPYADVKEGRFVEKPGNWQELVDDRQKLDQFLDGHRGLVLEGRDLRHLVAKHSFMPGSRFSDAVLEFADLRFAVLTRARLTDVSLRGARLDDADLRHAEIAGTEFEDLSAEAARLNHVQFQPSAKGRLSRLSGNFSLMSLDYAQGDGVQVNTREGALSKTQMNDATMRRVDFAHWKFRHVDLGNAVIQDARLTSSEWQDVNFGGTTIQRSVLNLGQFTRCLFVDPKIDDAQFDDAQFIDSEFDAAPSTRTGANGAPASPPRKRIDRLLAVLAVFKDGTRIRNIHFADATLLGASFEGSTLANVLFEDSDLSLAEFRGVDLSGVEFRRVQLNGAKLAAANGVTPALLVGACGNPDTQLPPGLAVRPCTPGAGR